MALTKVGTVSSLPPDSVMEVLVDRHPFAICNVGGAIRALDGVCLHLGGPLGHGNIQDGKVVCPFHMWEFGCATGEYDFDPRRRIATYAVKVEGDDIYVQVP